ncbi:Galactose oxidase/kelch, beta-propeller [Penicillium expansum]|uniref:Galactose oxidase/kelch, beta-propeller n=1 Tax=Penicillium expansum TaxID=27334 RepID=A0A0A2JEN8_PENEN|nr:Galactose oxidase/kelch, beta-propeller [Penicillium expansum]KGO53221.1 Galactose oxidase/kelch, beta-propeller [Penicillium expansum]KGO69444.1 Galactose oxidase/kelch, beta-propeller [Penicillium expansum]
MCSWQGLRANILRDTIYLDGGELWYQKGYDDGCVEPQADNNLEATIYYLNLTNSFNTKSDFMNLLSNMSVAGGAASIAPNYVEGTMFANDNEFYLYGGMHHNTDSSDPPPANQVLSYAAYQYGAYRSAWAPGWNQEYLTTNVTRYITNGAAASASRENLGFYFSGMRASDWGDFNINQLQSNQTADTLITLDMSSMSNGKWTNSTLPSYIPARSNAELVWVPVSESGALVAIGGVVEPIQFFRNGKANSTRTEESKKISPTFMEKVSVFDVGSGTWYLQNTTGDIPPQLTEFCSVLASAADGSSHNIYIYGGYDGLNYNANPSDDVYILSLPSFKWVKAYNGTNTHSRSGHQCIKAYPNQMLAVGGQHVDSTHCLEGGIIVNFNLNTLSFEDKYDPTNWSEYKVPDPVTKLIGGNSDGGATATAPESWTNSSLAGVFGKKYSKSIETYWPYNSTSGNTSTSASTQDHKGSSGFPGWAGGVIGAVLGLLVIAILAGLWFYRRRQRQRKSAEVESEAAGAEPKSRPPEWMYAGGLASPGPGPVSSSTGMETAETVRTTHTTGTQPSTAQQSITQPSITQASTVPDSLVSPATPGTVESGGDALYEMHDSSPVELPTPFNAAYFAHDGPPKPEPEHGGPKSDLRRGSQSPVSPQTPSETGSEYSYPAGHTRRPSSLSLTSPMSIENVMSGRSSHFYESFDSLDTRRAGHRSEVSQLTDNLQKGRKGGNETIREDE